MINQVRGGFDSSHRFPKARPGQPRSRLHRLLGGGEDFFYALIPHASDTISNVRGCRSRIGNFLPPGKMLPVCLLGPHDLSAELDLITGALLVLAGFATAFINVMAGGGSAVSLIILEPMLGANIANATNRVAIVFANVLGTSNFARKQLVPWKMSFSLIFPTMIGTAVGAWVATRVSNEQMRAAFAVVLIGVALSVLLKPSAWLKEQVDPRLGRWGRATAFLAIGFYGGFIQVGVGFLLISGLVLGCGLDLVKGSAAKMFLIACYTALAVGIFALADQINWPVGLVMAIGNSTGAYLGTRLAMEKGARLIRWLLAIASVAVALRMLFFQ